VSILVRNITNYDSTDDITVRLFYDGDPDADEGQWGTDQFVKGGLDGNDEEPVHFDDLLVPENVGGAEVEIHQICARLFVPGRGEGRLTTASAREDGSLEFVKTELLISS
ncbi:MAG: hypothetical protein IID49_15660, partial [Proteobacteria bacterium]|nr:hypothetical protein [Pseudomonadota bacterium]